MLLQNTTLQILLLEVSQYRISCVLHCTWLHGPSWLQDDDTLWPAWNFSDVAPEVLQQNLIEDETRKSKSLTEVSNMAVDNRECLVFGINQSKYSILRKLLCITILFYNLLRTKCGINLTQTKGRLFRDTSF